jgi:hypothetical protein
MRGYRLFIVCAVAGWIGLSAEVSQAALAKRAGGSGLSGQLSSNKAIRRQQLIADPFEPDAGSTSVQYDPKTVHLSNITGGPGFTISSSVEVRDSTGKTFLQDFGAFVETPGGIETGYVQVRFTFDPAMETARGQINPPSGYFTVDQKGGNGIDTHAFIFNYLSTVPDSKVAVYRVFADLGNTHSGNSRDFLSGTDANGSFTVDAADISGVTVRGSLNVNAVPLPPAVLAGGLMLAGVFGFEMVRRRRAMIA